LVVCNERGCGIGWRERKRQCDIVRRVVVLTESGWTSRKGVQHRNGWWTGWAIDRLSRLMTGRERGRGGSTIENRRLGIV
jgi:hypothetical protein